MTGLTEQSVTVRIYQYAYPLCRPLTTRAPGNRVRRGLLLRLEASTGAVGWGEAAPLPGFSRESLGDVLRQARALREVVVPAQSGPVTDGFLRWHGEAGPSLRFGLECAGLDLLRAADGKSLRMRLGGGRHRRLPLCGLVAGTDRSVLDEAVQLTESGYGCLKVKVGRCDWRQEAAAVRRLRDRIGPKCRLRLDANRAWSTADAAGFLTAVDGAELEYVEEPLADLTGWRSLIEGAGVPLALDESLAEHGVGLLDRCLGVRAVVLKPSAVGGLHETFRLVRAAAECGAYPVVSALYESGLGLRALAGLAAVVQPAGSAAGLDTHRWMAEDIVEPPFPVTGGDVDLMEMERQPVSPQQCMMEEVTDD